MLRLNGIAYAAATAGLSLAIAAAGLPTAVAQESLPTGEYASPYASDEVQTTGETRIYVKGAPVASVVGEGSAGQLRVTVPVAVHLAAMADGTLVGPSDGTVLLRNDSECYDVHVAKISVKGAGDASISASEADLEEDEVFVSFAPARGAVTEGAFVAEAQGTNDSLGNYLEECSPASANKYYYDMARGGGAVALNAIHGKVGNFSSLDAAADTQVGTVSWVVRAGTREDADVRDGSCTVHFHANGGFWNGSAMGDQSVEVLKSTRLPSVIAEETYATEGIRSGVNLLSKLEVDGSGAVERQFKGWYLVADPDVDDTEIKTFGDLGEAADIAGKTFTLYAHYE